MSSFRVIRQQLAVGWLAKGEGGLVNYSLGLVEDAFMQRLKLGHEARFPQGGDPSGETPAPDDALAALGRDRGIPRGIDETSSSYARRLLRWLDDRKRQGNPFELMHQLAGYVNDPAAHFRTFDIKGNWRARAADGTETYGTTTWNWDGLSYGTRWARFWVVIYPGSRWAIDGTYGDGHLWGDGRTWGTTATHEQVVTTQAIVNQWKPGGTRGISVIIAFDESSFNPMATEPDGFWGRWSKVVNGVRVPSRLATARYWDGDPNYSA